MNSTPQPKKTYGEKADAFLAKFYESTGASSPQHKIKVLELQLGSPSTNYYDFGGEVTDDMKLGCLEYEFLEQQEQIVLDLA